MKSRVILGSLLVVVFTGHVFAAQAPQSDQYVNSLGMRLLRIDGGTFRMGQLDKPLPPEIIPSSRVYLDVGDYDEAPIHTVTITKPFFMGVTEVTNQQYELFDPGHKSLRGKKNLSKADDEAVVFVNWYEAQAFCEWLSDIDGVPYRLPTEAEWEYACRAGTASNYHTGDMLSEDFRTEAARSGYHVAKTPPNAWGLYDMHGNVEEWCHDWYGPYRTQHQIDPLGYTNGDFRVTRGGSDGTEEYYLRSANRLASLPDARNRVIGFRVVIGELPDSKAWPMPEPPSHQQNVRKRSRAEVLKGPDPDKPYFAGPRKFVKIPRDMIGPIYGSHNHHPAIVECPNGDLLATWFTTVTEGGREVAQAASRLRRGSDQWDDASFFWYCPDRNGPPMSLWCDDDGVVYHFTTISFARKGERILAVRRSTDSGATWSKAHIGLAEHARGHSPAGSTFRMQDGTIAQTCDIGGGIIRYTSDGGLSWSSSTGRVAGIHAGVTQLADGRLLGYGRGHNIDDMMPKSLSEDKGETWTYSASEFPPIGGQQRLVLRRLKEGPLFFASFADHGIEITDASGTKRTVRGLFAAVSTDGGETWPWKRLISDDGPGRAVETTASGIFTMSRRNGEYRGYLRACQGANGLIHLVSSMEHYAFNLKWLQTPSPALKYPPVKVKLESESFSGPNRFDLDDWAHYHSYGGGFNGKGQYTVDAFGPVSGPNRIVGAGSFEMNIDISRFHLPADMKACTPGFRLLFRDDRVRNFSVSITRNNIAFSMEDGKAPANYKDSVSLASAPVSAKLKLVYNEQARRIRVFYGFDGAEAVDELPQSRAGIYFSGPLSESTVAYLLMTGGSMDLDHYEVRPLDE